MRTTHRKASPFRQQGPVIWHSAKHHVCFGQIVVAQVLLMAPILEAVAEERADLIVAKVNVDESSELAARFGVMSIPTLVVLDDGDEIKRIVGARPKGALLAELD